MEGFGSYDAKEPAMVRVSTLNLDTLLALASSPKAPVEFRNELLRRRLQAACHNWFQSVQVNRVKLELESRLRKVR